MRHLLATASLHDGGGLFSLAWSLVVIPLSLAVIFNYRGMADRTAARMTERMTKRMTGRMTKLMAGRMQPSWPATVSPLTLRQFAGLFLALGLIALGLAIIRFALGGY